MTAGISYLFMGGLSPGVFPPPVAPPAGGSSVSILVAASGDDGYWTPGGASFSSTLEIASGEATGIEIASFLLFRSLAIPPGTVISSASLKLSQIQRVVAIPLDLRIYGEAADSPSPVSSAANGDGRALTTAYTTINETNLPNTTLAIYIDFDVTAQVQEIVSRGAWLSGNNLQLLIKENTDTNNYMLAWSWDDADPANPDLAPRLDIAFGAPGQPTMRRWGGTPGMQPRRLGRGW